jgi:predicted phosphodiesterase
MKGAAGKSVLVSLLLFLVCLLPHAVLCQGAGSSLLAMAPFLGRPTPSSVTLNLVAGEKEIVCYVAYRKEGGANATSWQKTKEVPIRALSAAEIKLESLTPENTYVYQVYARLKDGGEFEKVTEQKFRSQKSVPSPFSFALISDSHITPFDRDRFEIISQAGSSILARKPDLFFMLGDNVQTFTSHGGPMTGERFGPQLYSLLRRGLGTLPSSVPTFLVNGNWDGENGWYPQRERGWARQARKSFIPNPDSDTYPEGGNEDQDYYGFTWGDVLFLVLNVTGYTPLDHGLGSPVGKADNWTLGEKQKRWLFDQLSRSKARWKFLLAHHTVAGKAGDEVNSRYGRGGGQAAQIGEQAILHGWMKQFGVQAFFYGHDHVFTDVEVDGIHYICVGSAGAPWKFPESVTGYKKYWTPSGYTWVDVSEERVKISFITPDAHVPEGKPLNSFELIPK